MVRKQRRLSGTGEMEMERVGQRLTPHRAKKTFHCLGRKESLLNETKKRKRKGKLKEKRYRTEEWACLDSFTQTIVE